MKAIRTFKEAGIVVVDGVNKTQVMAVGVEFFGKIHIRLQVRSYQSYQNDRNPRYVRISIFFVGIRNWFYRKLRNTRFVCSNGFGFGWTLHRGKGFKTIGSE